MPNSTPDSAPSTRATIASSQRFRRAMTTEVPDSGGANARLSAHRPSRPQSAKRRRSLWAERYANQQWATVSLAAMDRPSLGDHEMEQLKSRHSSKQNSLDRPPGGLRNDYLEKLFLSKFTEFSREKGSPSRFILSIPHLLGPSKFSHAIVQWFRPMAHPVKGKGCVADLFQCYSGKTP